MGRLSAKSITLVATVAIALMVSCAPGDPAEPSSTLPPQSTPVQTSPQPSPVQPTTTQPHTQPPATEPKGSLGGSPAELTVAGHLDMAVGPGHITDVWALGSYAYLGSFDRPACSPEFTGVHIVDISEPASPAKVGFIPAPFGGRINDVKLARIENAQFKGDILVHSNEPCSAQEGAGNETPAPDTDGISIYDVTDPLRPRELVRSFLEVPVHNAFIIQTSERALLLVVSDGRFIGSEERDFFIVDITDPSVPEVLSLTGAPDWGVGDQVLGAVRVAGLHDVWAQSYPESLPNPVYAGRTIAYLAYWDAGLVILDITEPESPVFLGQSEYLDPDPVSGQSPEGNSHVAVPTEDGRLIVMGDEDFSTRRAMLIVGSGLFAGDFDARELAFTSPLTDLEGEQVSGPATFIGQGCEAGSIPPPQGNLRVGEVFVAIIERGDCPVDEKISNAARAGYGAAVLFNSAEDPDRLTSIQGDAGLGTIPGLLVDRRAGFAMLGIDPASPANTPLPPAGTAAANLTLRQVFDGWGYGRILDVSDPKEMHELGQFFVPNVVVRTAPPGDHSMHNVVVDGRRAYVSWYADGMRVFDFSDPTAPREIARFVDEVRGSNFWGVYLHRHPNGETYVLGSDRDSGLWIFETP